MQIKDRTFVVSGGASGLGQATADLIVKHGGVVAILDMNEEHGQAAVKTLGASNAIFLECDVTSETSVASAVNSTVDWVSKTGKELGGVVAAAGVANPAKIVDHHGEPMDLEGLKFILDVNVVGTIDLVRQVVVHLVKNKPSEPDGERGVVVMVSSSAATDGQPGQIGYSASKGAISSLTLPMARDLARYGVRAVTIAPSLFDSAMTRMMSDKVRQSLSRVMEFPRRPGQPHEFASVIEEVIRNPMHNGSVIRLDGGMRMPSKM